MKQKFYLLKHGSPLLVFLLLLGGCKSKLDRDQAKGVIIQGLNLPRVETREIGTGSANAGLANVPISNYAPGEQDLQNEGYRTVQAVEYRNPNDFLGFEYTIFSFAFTGKATPFIISTTNYNDGSSSSKVKVADINFGEINNLRKVTDDEYEVQFSLSKNVNQIGEAYNKGVWSRFRNYNYKVDASSIQNLTAKIYRYDKGWQLATDDINSITQKFDPEQFQNLNR